jgi:hypothetical protein
MPPPVKENGEWPSNMALHDRLNPLGDPELARPNLQRTAPGPPPILLPFSIIPICIPLPTRVLASRFSSPISPTRAGIPSHRVRLLGPGRTSYGASDRNTTLRARPGIALSRSAIGHMAMKLENRCVAGRDEPAAVDASYVRSVAGGMATRGRNLMERTART